MPIADIIRPPLDELRSLRRQIHQHAELGLEEVKTSALVGRKLREWGIETTEGVGGTGVVGVVRGRRADTRSIGLRADMDALPIHEKTGLPYQSRNEGVMHACGHDGHTAMLLGAAHELARDPDFAGTVVLIFQPAEEGRGGARAMLDDGLFTRFPCHAIYGLHNRPGLAVGHIGVRPGPVMAAGDRWHVTFRGTGGHGGSTPHLATDVTVAAGHFLLGVQTIVSRNVAARDTAVLTVGYARAGVDGAPNVMPAEFVVGGVCRTFDLAVRDVLQRRLHELATSLAAAHGCMADVSYWRSGYAVVNADGPAAMAAAAAVAAVGDAQVHRDIPPSTGGEDFAEMMQVVPGCMGLLGNGADAEQLAPRLHTPHYDFNDEAIPFGIAYWLGIVQQELGGAAG
jgi:hippurate hydrolase